MYVVTGTVSMVHVQFQDADESILVRNPVPVKHPSKEGQTAPLDSDRHIVITITKSKMALRNLSSDFRWVRGKWKAGRSDIRSVE